METVKLETRHETAILRLHNGVTNAISPRLVADLSEALGRVSSGCRGMVLAGGSKFFSIGFNLPELLALDRSGMGDFFHNFNELAFDLFTLPLPTACAIGGHAIAGGTILALTCDYRFAGSGKILMGLNEARLGVPVPYLSDLILRQLVGDRAATEMLYGGDFLPASAAGTIGLVDEVVPRETVEDRAVEKLGEWASLPRQALSAIKANRVEAIRSRYVAGRKEKSREFLDCWFSPATRDLLEKAAEKF